MRYVSKGMGVLLSMGMAVNSWALGGANIGNEVPSARSAGQGYVGTAGQNDDPTVAWSNAGALPLLKGTQFTFGGHWENVHGAYQNDAGVETKARVTDVVVPNMALAHRFNDSVFALGLSVQTPFGLETHWAGDSPLRYVATDSRLAATFVSPSVAAQFTPEFSLGAGFDYVDLSNAQLDRHVNVNALNTSYGSPTVTSQDANASLKGSGSDWGGHAGFVYSPTSQHSFGFTYHTKVTVPVNGRIKLSGLSGASATVFGGTDYTTAAETELQLPENIQLGYAFKPTAKWQLEADAAWFHWSEFTNVAFKYQESNPFRLAALNANNPTPNGLHDAWSFSGGANYKYNDSWQFRGGMWYVPSSQEEAAFSPAYSDLTRYGVSTGVGYLINSSVTIDLAYSAVFSHNRTVHNNVGLNTAGFSQADISGTYKDFANLVAANVTYKFGSK
jgi:long-chain fatty acid transport protein